MIDFPGHRFAKDIILICARWYPAYPLSYRHLEEMAAERGVQVDPSNIYLWVQEFTPKLEAAFRRSGSKRSIGKSCWMDETCSKFNGQWKYPYRAVDKAGRSIDFLLTAQRDNKAAIDKGGANTAALEALQDETGATIEVRQNKYLNNLAEQDRRAVKRIVRAMLGLKSFWSARRTLAGIELMHMIKKGQIIPDNGQELSPAEQFYSLAA